MTTPDPAAAYIRKAEKFAEQAETWANADYGWMATMSTEERLQRRANDLAAAQVQATLATAARSRADARIAALRAALSDIFVKSTDGVATVTAINALRADDTETG